MRKDGVICYHQFSFRHRLLHLDDAGKFAFCGLAGKDSEDVGAGCWGDGGGAGKAAKGREHGKLFVEIEAGEAKGLFSQSIDNDAGVNMSGEAVGGLRRIFGELCRAFGDVVHEGEIPDLQVGGGAFDGSLAVPVVVEDIVVAFYEPDYQVGEVMAPAFEEIELFVFAAVEQIADYE